MLETQSRMARLIIWAVAVVVAVLAVRAIVLGPALRSLVAGLLDSQLAAFIGRNQTIIAGLGGFGGLALAYILNGIRDRAERRHVIERAERRTGAVLAAEAHDWAARLAAAAARQASGTPAGADPARIAEALADDGSLLLAAPITDIARLGVGASAVVRRLRLSIAAAAKSARDGTAPLGEALHAAGQAARAAATVLDALASEGPAAADDAFAALQRKADADRSAAVRP